MKIDKHNYEAFFLDYHEGNLAPQQVAELLLFVEQHPELQEEFESFENISLEDLGSIPFEFKAALKKEITEENRDTYFIGAVENTLTPAEQQLLAHFLKQHPRFLPELELYKKTKLSADAAVVFEDKATLKDIALTTDHLLIASVEGLLTSQENAMLNQQLAVDAEMQHALSLYKKTKVTADAAIVYENKEELKRRESRVIPLYYFIAAAAAILLIFGIFSLANFNDTNVDPGFAKNDHHKTTPPVKGADPVEEQPAMKENTNIPALQEQSAAVVKTERVKSNSVHPASTNQDSLDINTVRNNEPENKNLAQTNSGSNEQPVSNENPAISNKNEGSHDHTPAVAQIAKKATEKKDESEFLSLAQIAAKKIKEKTLDADTYASEKKTGRLKKISGWDVLQVLAKGVSKVTGKDVQVKPTYNEQGDVTAYAFNAGKLGFSKEK